MKVLLSVACCLSLTATACAGAGDTGGGSGTTLSVAIVSNSQMQDAQKLAPIFEREHPGIKVHFISLPENEARAKITASVATNSGEFDIAMISNYETPLWAKNGWLTNLSPYADKTPGYDPGDFIGPIRQSLSYKNNLYSVPFYGESSFLMYRKDLFKKAGLTMPAHPTWPQVEQFAAKLDDPKKNLNGICLRGDPGWGEVLAPLDTVINTFGGRWFDPSWKAQLDSPAVIKAVQFYTDLIKKYGEPGAAQAGFSECATQFGQGNSAMWYDATSAVSSVEDPQSSTVSGKVGYAQAPVVKTKSAGWLYTWSLAIPKTSKHKDAAWQFMSWMTSKDYMKLVGQKLGWSHVPPGSRLSTYQLPQYKKIATAFAQPTLEAIESADPQHPTAEPVPYTGVQFVDIPEFQDLGTRVSQQISAIIAGQTSVRSAMKQSQEYAQTVGDTYAKGTS
ncbi:MAG TPA: sugar ABC transporter substrate-binding protein [Mycobacteriales bacterium]|jgi:sorbitol/mannitol transport system substrate-binding protein|nr:sugar ABC transporter substrate-binding protein [Mycobacteriales bacterium]